MKVYVLIQEDRHYDTAVTVFADKQEAISTAAARIHRDVMRYRDDICDPISIEELAVAGAGAQDEYGRIGLTDFMRADTDADGGWLWYCNAYDDGPTARIIETNLVK